MGAGQDERASVLLDPLHVRHGRFALRFITPVENQGMDISPYWVATKKDARYHFSIWAKTDKEATELVVSISGAPAQSFKLTSDWQKYEFTWTPTGNFPRTGINLRYLGPGKAWLDLMQIVPLPAVERP